MIQTITECQHLWPGSFTHPSWKGKPPVWEECRQDFDCYHWQHRTRERTTTTTYTEWKEASR